MKKYIKELYIILIVIFSISFFRCNTPKKQEDKSGSKVVVQEVLNKKPLVPVEYYSENLTKKVNLKLDSLLKRIHKRHDFHGAILVAKNKKIVYRNQIGYADFRKKIPLKAASTFQLASVSKQFTAAAIMLLVERHKIKITDTVNTYFSDFPYKNITIKSLLNHTAGLPKYFWVAEHKWKEKSPPTNSEMMKLLTSSHVNRFFKPGRNFDYSNTAYFVLASIALQVMHLCVE